MNQELLTIPIGPELDATLGKLAQMLEKSREELVKLLLEEGAFAVEDTYEKSGQIWDSVRFDYVHGGQISKKAGFRSGDRYGFEACAGNEQRFGSLEAV